MIVIGAWLDFKLERDSLQEGRSAVMLSEVRGGVELDPVDASFERRQLLDAAIVVGPRAGDFALLLKHAHRHTVGGRAALDVQDVGGERGHTRSP